MSAPIEGQSSPAESVPVNIQAVQPTPELPNGGSIAADEHAQPIASTEQDTLPNGNAAAPDPTLSKSAVADEAAPSGPVKTPFSKPGAASIPDPSSQLTGEQQSKYQDLLNTVQSWTTVPNTSAKDAPTAPLTDDEKMWLTRECLLRYLRAVKWNTAEAPKRLMSTLVWRREYGLANHTADYISPENETGKQIILGYDLKARPCLYLLPSRQNTKTSERQIQHLVFMLERVIDLMVPDQESLSLLINFKDSGSGEVPKIGQGRQVLNILQSHYPERLGRAYVINLPWFVNGFFKLISPFIDPMTREKLKFNEDLRTHVPPTQLLSTMGGDVEFAYDHSVFWPALNEMAQERRSGQEERWVAGGKHIGESEKYLRGGPEKSVAESQATTTPSTTAV